MRSRAPVALMEQAVMGLVCALAAAVCWRLFALAEETSRRSMLRDRAVVEVQNTAELLKATGGTYRPPENGDWTLEVRPVQTGQPLLAAADVTAYDEMGELFSLRVSWQEADHG